MRGPEDVELAADPVGVASARLLADGVPRAERLLALRLLSVLLTVADVQRRIRRPVRDLAGEFGLPSEGIDLALGQLVDIGAVYDIDGILLVTADEPASPGISLHDFLDAAAAIETRPTAPAARPRRLAPAGAILAAAAVLAAVVLAPRITEEQPTTAAASRPAGVTSTAPPSSTASNSPASASERSDDPMPAVTDPVPVAPAAGPTTGRTNPPSPCPSGAPVIEVLDGTMSADRRLSVEGLVRNPTDQALEIHAFTISVGIAGVQVQVPGTVLPLVVPPHEEVRWQTLLPVAAAPTTPVTTALGDWVWQELPPGCPAPAPTEGTPGQG